MFPTGITGSRYGLAGGMPVGGGTSSNNQRRPSIGIGISEVVVKSNADVRALTYCDLKVSIFLANKFF